MARPVIGISCYREHARWGAWDRPADLLPARYVDALRAAGAAVVLLPSDVDVDEVLDRLDALVLAGGPDVDPARYSAAAHPTTDRPRPERDAAEEALYIGARRRDLPVLGICRGLQVMAVAEGGSLVQHLPDAVGDTRHRDAPGTFNRHGASFTPGSLVARILGTTSTEVNSSHHQGVADAGRLTVTGRADDGTIEVAEAPAARFVLGVQWHPEEDDDPRLFRAVVAAARATRP